ncbi:MAG: hypothetical protein GY796_36840 [Chloroflexi bacterium]|nr:hypothetical protein [Chloroflexota bacterium]
MARNTNYPDYAGQPVIFLEQDADNTVGSRYGRWWAAYSGTSATLPLMMVDSGNQISSGYVNFYNTYQTMVETSLARPPQADIAAYYTRVGDTLEFEVQVTNQSGVTLSWNNAATVHAIVYEEAHVNLTDRFVREAVAQSISTPLPDGDTAAYTLTTGNITRVNWDSIHSVVLVDYRPSESSGAYDTLQAVVPELGTFTITPNPLTFLVDSGGTMTLAMQGPSSLTWTVTNSLNWLEVTPVSGAITNPPTVSVVEGNLAAGWQQGSFDVAATDGGTLNFNETVTVQAFYGAVERIFLSVVAR